MKFQFGHRSDRRMVEGTPRDELEPVGARPAAHERSHATGRLAARSRAASIGVIGVLLAVAMFAVWSSRATADAATRVAGASSLSESYARAARAVSAEESQERLYRLEPGPTHLQNFTDSATEVVRALGSVGATGTEADRTQARQTLDRQADYAAAAVRLFAAVRENRTVDASRIDDTETDPAFDAISDRVLTAAADQQQRSEQQLRSLQRLENLTSHLTPAVFLLGLILVALLVLSARGYRRVLVGEQARAVHDSLHDALTGLPNRTLLADRLAQALLGATRDSTFVSLLLLDLDRFREINETYGHHYGDELLSQVGPRLQAMLRGSDSIARLGGNEFAVLLPDVADLGAAIGVAVKLRHAIETTFYVDGIELDVEASIGVVVSDEHGADATTLLRHADIAMHVAKNQNLGIFAYDPGVDGRRPERLALLGDLRRALERDEFVLHYQPKVSVTTGEVVGAEALVRWLHPTRGMVFPDAFIPVAENTGLIGPLTRRVLEIAITQARVWADAGHPLPVSVNLSARNLLEETLPDEVCALLARHGVPASRLELEVTESAIMTEPVRARRLLERLSKLGVRISIDDFGAGYTSLGQLKTLPVSELKIDRSFVMTMTDNPSDALIVHSVVDLGHNLGLTIVAEGVETAAALDVLFDFTCDIAQGYHIARPAPIETFDAWCRDRDRDRQSDPDGRVGQLAS